MLGGIVVQVDAVKLIVGQRTKFECVCVEFGM